MKNNLFRYVLPQILYLRAYLMISERTRRKFLAKSTFPNLLAHWPILWSTMFRLSAFRKTVLKLCIYYTTQFNKFYLCTWKSCTLDWPTTLFINFAKTRKHYGALSSLNWNTSIIGFFRLAREEDENYCLLGYYATNIGKFLWRFGTTFRSHCLSRNVGKELPLLAA
jgi:hypothetical protein